MEFEKHPNARSNDYLYIVTVSMWTLSRVAIKCWVMCRETHENTLCTFNKNAKKTLKKVLSTGWETLNSLWNIESFCLG
jgi:hypothetical protein